MAKGPKNPERSFGMSVGTVLCVIAALLWWRGRIGRAEVIGVIGGVLLLTRPRVSAAAEVSRAPDGGGSRARSGTSTRACC